MKFIIFCLLVLSAVVADKGLHQQFTDANNLFAVSAYKEVLKDNEGNLLISPLSAEIILSFAQAGCKGETAEELRNALHLPNDNSKIECGVKTFLNKLKSKNYTLQRANKMYIKEGFPINKEFKTVASNVYNADLENIDFTEQSEAANTVNQWVEKQTDNKIQNLINPSYLNNMTRAILINALYFKADWSTPFPLAYTEKGKFYKTANDVIEVDMMGNFNEHRYSFDYYECPHLNAKFLELPFKGGDASMTIILPNEKDGLAALENQIDRALTPHNLTKERVYISLPKFKIESQNDFKKVLINMGVKKAFDEKEADLSGIAGIKGDLLFDKIEQKSFITVDEEGVEAAAATYVVLRIPTSGIWPPPKQFFADHPFLFYIKIKNAIAFVGKVAEPKQ